MAGASWNEAPRDVPQPRTGLLREALKPTAVTGVFARLRTIGATPNASVLLAANSARKTHELRTLEICLAPSGTPEYQSLPTRRTSGFPERLLIREDSAQEAGNQAYPNFLQRDLGYSHLSPRISPAPASSQSLTERALRPDGKTGERNRGPRLRRQRG
jgi:hypothetical protein